MKSYNRHCLLTSGGAALKMNAFISSGFYYFFEWVMIFLITPIQNLDLKEVCLGKLLDRRKTFGQITVCVRSENFSGFLYFLEGHPPPPLNHYHQWSLISNYVISQSLKLNLY